DVGKSAAPMARGRHGARASNVEHLRLSVSPRETLSIGFRVLVSRHPAIKTTGRLTFAPAGLSPAEHASLAGHTTGHADFPHPALGQDFTPSPAARRGQARSSVRARSARRGA